MSDEATLHFADQIEQSGMPGAHFAAQALRTSVDPEIAMNVEAQSDPFSRVMSGLGATSLPSASASIVKGLPMPVLMTETAGHVPEGRMDFDLGLDVTPKPRGTDSDRDLDDLDAEDTDSRPELRCSGMADESAHDRDGVLRRFSQPALSRLPLDVDRGSTQAATVEFIRSALGNN